MVRGKYHRKSFERLGVLEDFDLAQPTEAASGQLPEVERGEVLGVE